MIRSGEASVGTRIGGSAVVVGEVGTVVVGAGASESGSWIPSRTAAQS